MEKISEKPANKLNGFLMLFLLIALIVLDIYLLYNGIRTDNVQILWIFINPFSNRINIIRVFLPQIKGVFIKSKSKTVT